MREHNKLLQAEDRNPTVRVIIICINPGKTRDGLKPRSKNNWTRVTLQRKIISQTERQKQFLMNSRCILTSPISGIAVCLVKHWSLGANFFSWQELSWKVQTLNKFVSSSGDIIWRQNIGWPPRNFTKTQFASWPWSSWLKVTKSTSDPTRSHKRLWRHGHALGC